MKRVILLSVFVAVLISASATLYSQTQKETRNVSGFDAIGFGIAGNLHIKTGPQFSVVIEADKDFLTEIETVVKNGKLVIRDDNNRIFNNEKADIYITMPELKGLSVSGSGIAQIDNPLKNNSLDLSVSGSGKIIAPAIVTAELDCSISGSGNINLKAGGEIGKGDISISGSGHFSGEGAGFKTLEIGISGSGGCTCSVTESLNASISGSGNVYYTGNPRVNARVSGSGKVRSK